ncbi:MAG: NAD-dependent epimerase/dehydratase family protein [bacterium]
MKALIIGGAGFIGCNIAARRLGEKDHAVLVLDNLSRKGTPENLRWLRTLGEFEFIQGDIRRCEDLEPTFRAHPDIDVVYHMAAQSAVTISVRDPREDFEINALGTFNVLEAIRRGPARPVLVFASTNKVYGGMEDVAVVEVRNRYTYRDFPHGMSEQRALDFHSPYGCSKGAADQYVRDYARIYGLETIIFRQSCIYGYRQFGLEDQGWVAWFTIQAVLDRPVTIFGDGKQVRDMLFIEDLLDAYDAAVAGREVTRGKIYNIGGGPRNRMSLHDLILHLEERTGRRMKVRYDGWRPGDQPVFLSNVELAKRDFGWEPVTPPETGVGKLFEWVSKHASLFLEMGL